MVVLCLFQVFCVSVNVFGNYFVSHGYFVSLFNSLYGCVVSLTSSLPVQESIIGLDLFFGFVDSKKDIEYLWS